MKKIDHIGTVVAIEDQKAVVQLKPEETCGSTFRCACCSSLNAEPRTIRVDRNGLEEGDVVCASVPAYVGYLGTLVIFVLPIVLFVAGIAIGSLFEEPGGAHGTPTVVGGVCGFGLAILVAVLVNAWLAKAGGVEVRQIKTLDAQGPDARAL